MQEVFPLYLVSLQNENEEVQWRVPLLIWPPLYHLFLIMTWYYCCLNKTQWWWVLMNTRAIDFITLFLVISVLIIQKCMSPFKKFRYYKYAQTEKHTLFPSSPVHCSFLELTILNGRFSFWVCNLTRFTNIYTCLYTHSYIYIYVYLNRLTPKHFALYS